MAGTFRVLLVSGSLRARSVSSAVLRTAAHVVPAGCSAVVYDGLDALPHFDPDRDREPLSPAVARLRDAIRDADAVVFCTPEYAGALPGSFKNLLDWTIGDDRPGSIYNKPVAWINASASPTGAADAYESLRRVLRYAHAAIVEGACTRIPVGRGALGGDGLIADPAIRAPLRAALEALVVAHGGGAPAVAPQ